MFKPTDAGVSVMIHDTGLELIDAAVGLQRQIEMSFPDDVGAYERLMLHDAVEQRSRRAHGAGERERTEFELTRCSGLPRAAPPYGSMSP